MSNPTHPVDLSLAASHAQHIVRESDIVQKLVAGQVVCRQILLLLSRGLHDHVDQEYELERLDLVIEQLNAAALNRAASTAVTVDELREHTLTMLLPLIDIFAKMEEDYAEAKQKDVLRDDPDAQDSLGAVLRDPTSSE